MIKKLPQRIKHQSPKNATVNFRFRLEDAFDEFLRAKRIEQLKPRTLEDHVKHFEYFKTWLKSSNTGIIFIDEITVHTIRNYIDFMLNTRASTQDGHVKVNDDGLSPVTVNIRLRTLKCFFRWLRNEGMISEDPVYNIKLLKTEEDTIQGFTDEQVHLLLTQPDISTYTGFRDYCLMLLLLDTGARITEALAVKTDHIDFINGGIYFPSRVTKNRKAKSTPLSTKVLNAIKELIEENEANFGKQEYVFLSVGGIKLEPYDVRRRFSMYGRMAGLSKEVRVSPHTFRHTFATMYIKNGGDIFTLQKILGHSSMEMVRKYVQMTQQDLKGAHVKYSPLNKFELED